MEVAMPWTEITRLHYRREGLSFASDTTDAEWAVLAPLMPVAAGIGRPRRTDLRAVVNGIFYVLRTGCPWRALPKDFPPRSTVQGYFYRWRDDGSWHCINRALVKRAREAVGRKAAPSACIIDSQSAKTTESGGPRGLARRVSCSNGARVPRHRPRCDIGGDFRACFSQRTNDLSGMTSVSNLAPSISADAETPIVFDNTFARLPETF